MVQVNRILVQAHAAQNEKSLHLRPGRLGESPYDFFCLTLVARSLLQGH